MLKYKNINTRIKSERFDSKLEAFHYQYLLSRLKNKEIKSLARQVSFSLSDKKDGTRNKIYKADFVFFDFKLNSWIIMDSKGMRIEPYMTKRDWLLDKFNGFIFLEKRKDKDIYFKPYGLIKIEFKD